MKLTTTINTVAATIAASLFLAGTSQKVDAMPVNGLYLEDPRCDTIPTQNLTDELGDAAVFPINEGILYQSTPSSFTVCVPNDGNANDWLVRITNVSGQAWQDLFFVVDLGGVFGNADGRIADLTGAPAILTDAMRIDGTVTVGVNNNLLSESMIADEIFAPGEVWLFNVSNFSPLTTAGTFASPIFITPGIFAGSSPLGPGNPGNASILANPVPEPASIGLIAAGAALLLARRRSVV